MYLWTMVARSHPGFFTELTLTFHCQYYLHTLSYWLIRENFSSHHNIWRDAQVPQKTFTYYHPESRGLDFSGLMNDIKVVHSLTF